MNSGYRLANIVSQMVEKPNLGAALEHVAPLVDVESARNKVYTYNRVQNTIQELIGEFKDDVTEHCAAQMPMIEQQLSNFESSCVFERKNYNHAVGITEADASGIRVAASFLPLEADASDELEKIRKQIDDAKKAIREFEGEKHLKCFLHELLDVCIESIEEFKLLGPRRLKKRLEQMLGKMFRDSLYNPSGKGEAVSAARKTGIVDLVLMIDRVHATVKQYTPLLSTTKQYLLGESSDGES